jgi:hypothetical protein
MKRQIQRRGRREKSKRLSGWVLERKGGGDEGIRTLDLCVANAPLSHLSYIPMRVILAKTFLFSINIFCIQGNFRQQV